MVSALGYVRLVVGGGIVLLGVLSVLYPYEISRLEEAIDAIGSTRSLDDVEPATWKVTLTRIVGFVLVLFGVLWALPAFPLIL